MNIVTPPPPRLLWGGNTNIIIIFVFSFFLINSLSVEESVEWFWKESSSCSLDD